MYDHEELIPEWAIDRILQDGGDIVDCVIVQRDIISPYRVCRTFFCATKIQRDVAARVVFFFYTHFVPLDHLGL